MLVSYSGIRPELIKATGEGSDCDSLSHSNANPQACAGTHLMLTTAHPIFAGEWLELETGEQGMFVSDYFSPPAEVRHMEDSDVFVRSHAWPVGDLVQWVLDTGLTLKALVDRISGMAQEHPVLFLFEDAHWIDPTSQELLDRTAEQLESAPVLMVVTHRPEYISPWVGRANVPQPT